MLATDGLSGVLTYCITRRVIVLHVTSSEASNRCMQYTDQKLLSTCLAFTRRNSDSAHSTMPSGNEIWLHSSMWPSSHLHTVHRRLV